MFQTINPAPADPILGLTEAFRKDTDPGKVNLGVGIYKDESGKTPILKAILEAEARLLAEEGTKSYLPIPGAPEYGGAVQSLLFGEQHSVLSDRRARTAHTPGGTGALRVGGDFIHRFFPQSSIWVSTPTWANHKKIFEASGIPIKDYPYYNPETHGLDFDAMIAALEKVPAGDVVLIHACCHNPTGVDLSLEQWNVVGEAAAKAGWLPFIDFAYQGFGESVEADREGILQVLEHVDECLIASSFSKNLGLYRERTGAFTLVGASAAEADTAFSQIKVTIRTNYSNPPAHGGLVAKIVLTDPTLRALWIEELDGMRERIFGARKMLVDGLSARNTETDFSFITDQRGMFSFSGLTSTQVEYLKNERAIYIVGSGRINVAGVSSNNVDYLCDSIAEALKL